MIRVLFFSAATSTTVCSSRQLQCRRVAGHHVGRRGQPLGGLVLTVGGDDPGPPLAFGLGLPATSSRFMLPGRRETSLSSTRSTRTPHGPSVGSSMIRLSSRLTVTRSVSS